MRVCKTVSSCAKVTLCLLNLWVLCVILVVALGHWRVFDADLSLAKMYDDSHLVVMRELKEDTRINAVATNRSSKLHSALSPDKKTKKPDTPISPVQQEIKDRVSTMSQWCSRLHPNQRDVASLPADRLGMVLVNREYRLLFCQIPGVAQNDWRRILIYLTGEVNVTSHLKISAYDAHGKYGPLLKKLSDFGPDERRKIVQESLKVVFVRDPFERLVSSYQNKFQAHYSKYFHETFGTKIVQRYRTNATAKAKKEGKDVAFKEFVRFVVDSERESDAPLNEHWERYYKQCHPCVFHYDVVGKFETLADDTVEVLSRANALNKLKPPYVADTLKNSEATLKKMFQTVTPSDLKRLWNIYYPDYNLFSYQYPQVLQSLFQKSFHDY